MNAKQIAQAYLTIEQGKGALNGATENVWGDLCQYVKPTINDTNPEHALAYLVQTVEAEIRIAMGGKGSMPGAYRSAKSVIKKAIEKGVSLYELDGSTRGKTAVEKDCKEDKSDEQRIEEMLGKVRQLMTNGAALTPAAAAILADIVK